MNVTIVAFWAHKLFDPDEPGQFGGAEVQLYLLSKYWIEHHGAKVRMITRGRGPYCEFDREGIRVCKLPYRSNPLARAALGMLDLFRACLRGETDVFIQRGGGVETGVTGLAARWLGKPFLFMVSHIWDVNRIHELKRGAVFGMLYMAGLRRASAVIAQTDEQRALLVENYSIEARVLRSAHHIPEPVEPSRPGVLWISRCDDWKRPHACLDIAEALPHLAFTMVCPLIQPRGRVLELFHEIEDRAARIANVRFVPGVPFEETEPLFAEHSIFLNTSENEGYPNTYVQAMKWGRPVVALEVNPDGILTREGVGVCANGSIGEAVEAVRRLAEDRGWWLETSRNARDYALRNHDIRAIGDSIYKQLVDLMENSAGAEI
ncbi:MAG: glycosyltransferase [bacterium]|nr:glycosyltransferase [bacterium]